MSKKIIANATHAAAADRADLGRAESAHGWFEVALLLHQDSRGGKAVAEAIGRPHGTYQRAERLGRLIESRSVAIPARPADRSGKEYVAWEKECKIARESLHGACMATGVTVPKLVGLARRTADQQMAPSAMLAMLVALRKDEEPTADALIERIAKAIAGAAEAIDDMDIAAIADRAKARAEELAAG